MIINMTSGGVVPERIIDAQTITPGTENQVIEEGTYLRGPLTIQGDADLVPKNIPVDVNLFGIQGARRVNEGYSVWRRNVVTEKELSYTNPDVIVTYNSYSNVLNLYTETFDMTKIENYVSFFGGFQTGGDPNRRFVQSGNYLQVRFSSDTVYAQISSFTVTDSRNATMIMGRNWESSTMSVTKRYSGEKIARTMKTSPLEFVVDDNPDVYPNGSTGTDGLYYELIGQVASANVMSLSNGAVAAAQQDYRNQIETEVSNA